MPRNSVARSWEATKRWIGVRSSTAQVAATRGLPRFSRNAGVNCTSFVVMPLATDADDGQLEAPQVDGSAGATGFVEAAG